MRARLVIGLLAFTMIVMGFSSPPTTAKTTTPTAESGFWQGWTLPVNISQNPKSEPQTSWPTLGVSEDGQMIYLAWSDDRGVAKDIYYAASVDGGWNWETARSVAETALNSLRPSLVVSGTTASVAWADEHSDKEHHTTYQMELGSDAPTTVPNARDTLASAPQLTRGPGDELHLALQGGLDNQTDILYSYGRIGATTWPTATVVFTHTVIGSSDPALVVSDDGQTLHLVWQEKFSPNQSKVLYKQGQRSGEDVVWQAELSLSEGITLSVRPVIAVEGNTVHVAWGEQEGTGLEKFRSQYVHYIRSDDGGDSWGASHRVNAEPFSTNSVAPTDIAPALVIMPSGALCSAWHGFRSDAPQEAEEIYLSCSTDGGSSWGAPVNVSRSAEEISIRPRLAASNDNVLHLAWQEFVGPSAVSNYQIYYAHSLPYSVLLPIVRR